MALLLPHQTVGLVEKMKLWHNCNMHVSALDITLQTGNMEGYIGNMSKKV